MSAVVTTLLHLYLRMRTAGNDVPPQAGVTTDVIDKAVHKMIIDAGAYPSPLTYGNFPKSVCTSVNECICHGIPDARALVDGDIVNIDVTVYLDVSRLRSFFSARQASM